MYYAAINVTTECIRTRFKVSARVKKGEFSKFLISRRSHKAFQELSFKKKFHKKILFQCKVIGR